MKTKLVLSAAILLALAVVASACTEETVVQPSQQLTGLSVSGEGKVTGSPDVAVVTLGVWHESKTVAEAREAAAGSMTAMIDALKSNGVDEKDIQTTQFYIDPQYDYDDGRQTLRGYRVTNIVAAKIRDIDKTGDVIDAAVAAGGDDTQVQSLSFTIDDPSDLQAEARELAMKDAKEKAEALAKAGGISLGKPLSVSESTYGYPPPIPYAAADFAGAETKETPIQPGQLDVTVQVSVLYEIK